MNIVKTFSIIVLSALVVTTASAQRICSTKTPQICTDVTKMADPDHEGTFFYACTSTGGTQSLNTNTSLQRITGTCTSDETCKALEDGFVNNLNWQGRLSVTGARSCNSYSPY